MRQRKPDFESESPSTYSEAEEKLNVLTHGLGLLLSIPGLILLLLRASETGEQLHLFSFGVFGCSMILLYAASTFYHHAREPRTRYRLNILDHACIYILIAGTYTPFTLVTLHGRTGWILFGVVWGLALIGIVLKLFFTGRFRILSTVMYVLMGWVIVFAINPMMENLSREGLWWIVCGGIAYTVGAILYSIKRIPYNHAIFHVFVLLGTFCHFMAVYWHVYP